MEGVSFNLQSCGKPENIVGLISYFCLTYFVCFFPILTSLSLTFIPFGTVVYLSRINDDFYILILCYTYTNGNLILPPTIKLLSTVEKNLKYLNLYFNNSTVIR